MTEVLATILIGLLVVCWREERRERREKESQVDGELERLRRFGKF